MSGVGRRNFLRTAAGAAALTVSSRLSSFGRVKKFRLNASMASTGMHDRLQPDWYRRKVAQVQQEMAKRKLDGIVLMHAPNVIYTTGYFHISTERPLATFIPAKGDPALFVPGLEEDQVKLWWVKDYESYFDYPGPVNRVRWIFERVAKRGMAGKRIAIEEAGPSRMEQIKLGAPKAEIVPVADDLIMQMRWIKDDDEINIKIGRAHV